jgi:hypothetical protein
MNLSVSWVAFIGLHLINVSEQKTNRYNKSRNMLDRRDGAKYIVYINVSGIIFE